MLKANCVLLAMVLFVCTACTSEEQDKKNKGQIPSQPQVEKKSTKWVADVPLDETTNTPKKAMQINDSTRVCDQPGNTNCRGRTLELFDVNYLFAEQKINGNIYYQLSTTKSSKDIFGWILAKNAQYWPLGLIDRLVRIPGKAAPTLYIYASLEDQVKALKKKQVYPIAKAKYDTWAFMGWPVLETRIVKINGKEVQIDKIAILAKPKTKKENTDLKRASVQVIKKRDAIADMTIADIKAGIKMIDIVFVIDTTASMDPYIQQTKKAVRTITNSLRGVDRDLAFGLVEYRDFHPDLNFKGGKACRVYPLKKSSQFLNDINNVKAATKSSPGWEEAVLEGVNTALTNIVWRDTYSEKIIILIGDNSGKEYPFSNQYHKYAFTKEHIVKKIKKQTGLRLFPMIAPNRNKADKAKHREQFQYLAEKTNGSVYELKEARGLVKAIKGLIMDDSSKRILAKAIMVNDLIDGQNFKAASTLGEVSQVLKTKAGLVTSNNAEIDAQIELVDLLENSNVDLKMLRGDSDIGYTTGWIIRYNDDGEEIVEREVFTTHGNLDALVYNLSSINILLAQESQAEATEALTQLRNSVADGYANGEFPRFIFDGDGLTMSLFLQANHMVPYKESILNMTLNELKYLTQKQRSLLYKDMNTYIYKIQKARNNNKRFPKTSGKSTGVIPVKFLP